MPLNAQILMSIIAQESSSSNMATTMRTTPASYSLALTDGTGANQSQLAWSEVETVGGDAANELMIQALSDDRGVVNLASVKAIYVRNKSATSVLSVTAQNWSTLSPTLVPFNHRIQPGGAMLVTNPGASGWTTGASSALSLVAAASGETVNYDLVLIGEGTVA
jgi:hypothetical protein